MKLYYSPGACSLADHIALEWIGKPYETVRLSRDDRKAPAYLKINPAGAVPSLDDDGWVLTQNAAILNYLADRFPDARLGGDGTPKSRAQINQWLAFVNSDVHTAFKPLFGALAYLEDDAMVEKAQDDARQKIRGLLARTDAQLAGKDWLTGTRSIADPYLYVMTRWAKANNVDLSGLDNLARFSARLEGDAGVAKVLKEEGLA